MWSALILVAALNEERYGLCRWRTVAMASTSEITQLAQRNQTRQPSGERKVLRNNLSPAASALRMEALKTYSRMPLA